MLDEFQQLFISNRAPPEMSPTGKLNVNYSPRKSDSPTHLPDGTPIVYIDEPKDDKRHVALGKFLDAWSRLEGVLVLTFSQATGIPPPNVRVLMNQLGMRGVLETVAVLAPAELNAPQQKRLAKLLERVKANNTRRNNIVHGKWVLEVRLYDWNGRVGSKLFQYRYYEPSDPVARQELRRPENKDVRLKYLFSISRLTSLAKEVGRLAQDVSNFNTAWLDLPEGGKVVLIEGPLPDQ